MLFIEYQNWRTMGTNSQWSNKNNEFSNENLMTGGNVWLYIILNACLIDFNTSCQILGAVVTIMRIKQL